MWVTATYFLEANMQPRPFISLEACIAGIRLRRATPFIIFITVQQHLKAVLFWATPPLYTLKCTFCALYKYNNYSALQSLTLKICSKTLHTIKQYTQSHTHLSCLASNCKLTWNWALLPGYQLVYCTSWVVSTQKVDLSARLSFI